MSRFTTQWYPPHASSGSKRGLFLPCCRVQCHLLGRRMLQCHAKRYGLTPTCQVQMLVRAHVAANTVVQTLPGGPLSDGELQEGLMAGFGGRARRKHMQRHAARTGSQPGMQQTPDSVEHGTTTVQLSDTSDNDEPAATSTSNEAAVPTSEQTTSSAVDSEDQVVHLNSTQPQSKHAAQECSSSETDKALQDGPDAAAVSVEQPQPHIGSAAGRGEPQDEAAAGLAAGAPATDSGRGGHFWHGER